MSKWVRFIYKWYSIKQHKLISRNINKSNINKVYVHGKFIKETFKGLKKNKKAKILDKKSKIIDLIKEDLNNNDYLMIKGSNATGLHKITNILKQSRLNVVWIFTELCWNIYFFECI